MMPALDSVPRIASLGADDDRFQVHGALEIAGIMRRLISHRSLVSAHASDHAAFFVTALLAIDGDNEGLIFDFGADAALTERMLRSPRLTFLTQLDHVRIQFAAERAQAIDYEGGPAFRVPMPRVVTRLQRREYYRLRIPQGRPLHCQVNVPDAVSTSATAKRMTLRVHDISCGGLALSGWPDDFVPSTAVDLVESAIDLPDLGRIVANLRIVHVQGSGSAVSSGARLGCKFVAPSSGMVLLVQRHINRIERDQRALT